MTTFVESFIGGKEQGACVSAYVGAEEVVNLWGGFIDRDKSIAWNSSTITNIFSAAKSVYAFVVHLLVDDGVLNLDSPVCRYWHGFESNGKEDITVRQLLSHKADLLYFDHAPDGLADSLAEVTYDLPVLQASAKQTVAG